MKGLRVDNSVLHILLDPEDINTAGPRNFAAKLLYVHVVVYCSILINTACFVCTRLATLCIHIDG